VRRLLLLLRRRRGRKATALGTLPRHYCAEDVVTPTNGGRLLRRAAVLWRGVHAARGSAARRIKLTAQHRDLLFVFHLERLMVLFHLIDSVPYNSHFLKLFTQLMLVAFCLAEVRFELCADAVKELVEATPWDVGRRGAPHTAMAGIHRHRVAFRGYALQLTTMAGMKAMIER